MVNYGYAQLYDPRLDGELEEVWSVKEIGENSLLDFLLLFQDVRQYV